MKTLYANIRKYIKKYPARTSGYFSAITIYLYHYIPAINADSIMFFVSIFIGMGEAAQRAEDKKTIMAIYLNSDGNVPDDDLIEEAMNLHKAKHSK